MSRHNTERRTRLTLVDPPQAEPLEASADPAGADPVALPETNIRGPDLRRTELSLQSMAGELAQALVHVERATMASKGTGFTGRLREALDELDELQRSASAEFGRKVGDRLGREALWRRRRGVDV